MLAFLKIRQDLSKSVQQVKKKIGDIIEIPTSKGLAYVQYTHEDSIMGSLIRVLQGFYEVRPSVETILSIVNKPHKFQRFCQIYVSVNNGDWERVGNFQVPEFVQKFPLLMKIQEK